MEYAGASVSILTNAFTLGRELTTLYQTLANAWTEIAERIVYLRAQWNRMRVQLEIIERIWSALGESHQIIQAEILGVLNTKLKSAKDRLTGLLVLKERDGREQPGNKKPSVKRWKYLFVKPYLDDTMKSLDKWQNMYDPSFYLIVKVSNPLIDTVLQRDDPTRSPEATVVVTTARQVRGALRGNASQTAHLSLSSRGTDEARTSMILHTSARYMERPGKAGLVIDSIHCLPGSYVGDMDKDIRTLAGKLHYADPTTFGVLKCRGVAKVMNSNGSRLKSFDLVLETPGTNPPRSLRNLLLAKESHTLTERIELAKQLARSVTYVHTLDFVHKNIWPENLIGFHNDDDKLGPFYLIGFQQLRSADGMSYFRGDTDWEKNIYRHPERQGLNPQERYRMQHDIYSLGVCLLEIGLWESFVLYPEGTKAAYPNVQLLGLSVQALQKKSANGIKRLLIEFAQRELPVRMGELYE